MKKIFMPALLALMLITAGCDKPPVDNPTEKPSKTPAQAQTALADAFKNLDGVTDAVYRPEKNFIEVFMDRNREVSDDKIIAAAGKLKVTRID